MILRVGKDLIRRECCQNQRGQGLRGTRSIISTDLTWSSERDISFGIKSEKKTANARCAQLEASESRTVRTMFEHFRLAAASNLSSSLS